MIDWINAYRWALLRLFGALAIGATGILLCCQGCTAAQRATLAQDATAIEPGVTATCGLIDATDVTWLEFVCNGVAAADSLVARLPQAQKVSTNAIVDTNGNTVRTVVHVRCPLTAFAIPAPKLDGGAG